MGPLSTAPGMTIAPARLLTDHLPICQPKMLEWSFTSEGTVYLFIYLAMQTLQTECQRVTGLLASQLEKKKNDYTDCMILMLRQIEMKNNSV